MSKSTDIRVTATELYLIPVKTRVPLKFGTQVLTEVTCARARVTVRDRQGRTAEGWGETPLSVAWVWPVDIDYTYRHDKLLEFSTLLARELPAFDAVGHPIEIGYDFQRQRLEALRQKFNENAEPGHELPVLAALVCLSAFDIAVHDAFGNLVGLPSFDTYTAEFGTRDLCSYLTPASDTRVEFTGKFVADFLEPGREQLPVWHLVGGLDPLDEGELTGEEPDDGYPVLLRDWIRRDGLKCLKIKLRGNDAAWDYDRLLKIGRIAIEEGVDWLTTDFNCTVKDPAYVNDILDRLMRDTPRIHGMILYVEQPFPHELEEHPIDVHSVSARKPLFLDESAHDWTFVRMGRRLGWTGVALKTCKTLTGALLSLSWAKAHGMTLMVQDLTNPMLAQIPHAILAAHAGTIMGVESNGMQFYPKASAPEEKVHPRLYERREGILDLSTLDGSGMGYRLNEIARKLPAPVVST